MDQPRPFPLDPTPIHVPDEVLADLGRRLAHTRWFDDEGNDDWYYGVNGAYLRELVDYWRDGYDWRAAEAAINAYEHYRVRVDGVPVHFLRRPGPRSSTPWPTPAPTAATRPRPSRCWCPRSPGSGSPAPCPSVPT